jgi:acetyl-CoA carboxylase biotin carboxyl carrier protein
MSEIHEEIFSNQWKECKVSTGQIDFQDVLALVELIKASSNFSEIRLRSGDVEIELRRNGGAGFDTAPPSRAAAAASAVPSEAALASRDLAPAAVAPMPAPKSAAAPAPASAEKPQTASRQGTTVIKSPMVGTVYLAPEPGAAPFVKVGQTVSPGDQLCIVEVMKLMNSIHAESHGVITEILVADGEAVEYAQELFVISPTEDMP